MPKLTGNLLDFDYYLEPHNYNFAEEIKLTRRKKLLQELARELETFELEAFEDVYINYFELALIFAYENGKTYFDIGCADMYTRIHVQTIDWHINNEQYNSLLKNIKTILLEENRKVIIEILGKEFAENLELIDGGWE